MPDESVELVRYMIRRKDGRYYRESKFSKYFGSINIWDGINNARLYVDRCLAESVAKRLNSEVEEFVFIPRKDLDKYKRGNYKTKEERERE